MALDVSRKEGGGILGFFGSLFGFSKKDNLKSKVMDVIVRLRAQHDKLGDVVYRLESRGRELFDMAVKALESRDLAKATVYAAEVAEIRKIAKTVMTAKLALERVALRLETIREMGDLLVTLGPVVGVVKELRSVLMGVMPETALELREIDDLLESVIIDAGEFMGVESDVYLINEEAKKILQEATMIAEQRMKERFPELPSSTAPSTLPQPPAATEESK